MGDSEHMADAVPARAEFEAFNLSSALQVMCDQIRGVLGWDASMLLLNDEATGLSCLVAASGLPDDLLEIVVGAGVGKSEDVTTWFESETARGDGASLLEELGAGTPFSLDAIAGGALSERGRAGVAAVVPIRVRGRVAGAIAAYGVGSVAELASERLRLLELVGTNASALVEQSTAAERTERRFEIGQVLARLANRIYRLREPAEILEITVHDLRAKLDADLCGVLAPKGSGLVVEQESIDPQAARSWTELPIESHIERAVEQGVAVARIDDDRGSALVLLAPIFIRDDLAAVLACAVTQVLRAWQPYEIELVRGVADQLGIALSEARLHAEQEAARRDLECLLAGSQALAEADDLDTVLAEILVITQQAVGPRFTAVLLSRDGSNRLTMRAHRGCRPTVGDLAVPLDGPSTAARAARERTMITTTDTQTPALFVLSPNSVSALAAPLVVGERLVGVLLVESTEPRPFGERESKLLAVLAHETAVAIHRTQLFDRVALGKREWEATFDAMEDAVLLLDREGRILRANVPAGGVFGGDHKALLGVACCSVLCNAAGLSTCATKMIVEQARRLNREVRIGGAPYTLSASPIRNRAGVTTGSVAVLRARPPGGDIDGASGFRVGR